MNAIVSRTRNILYTIFSDLVSLPVSNGNVASFKKELLRLCTAVAGHDNKHTYYKTQIKQKWKYGDDACFVASNLHADILGIADGVGGWRTYGIDPSDFSQTLMSLCQSMVNQNRSEISNPQEPLIIISQAYNHLSQMKRNVYGSATTCVLRFERSTGLLSSASIGDTGYLVVRKGRVIYQSASQKHAFNTPFQLARLPAHLLGNVPAINHDFDADLPIFLNNGRGFYSDSPELAQFNKVLIREGDVVVAASDGLFDNLSPEEIAELVHEAQTSAPSSSFLFPFLNSLFHPSRTSFQSPSCSSPTEPAGCPTSSSSANPTAPGWLHVVAQRLVETAHLCAHQASHPSPFSKEARRYGLQCRGGNPGDITVILGLVVAAR